MTREMVGDPVIEEGCDPDPVVTTDPVLPAVLPLADVATARRVKVGDDVLLCGFPGGVIEENTFEGLDAAFRLFWSKLHLVLNMSVGMDKLLAGQVDNPAMMEPGIEALYRALQFARCHGVLSVAAAGNLSVGPVLPAYWESHEAPSAWECYSLFGINNANLPDGAPLLVAMGGIQSDGSPLANASSAVLCSARTSSGRGFPAPDR